MEFHPEDYGAVCDGTANDQPAIDAAVMDAVNQFSGGTVILDDQKRYGVSIRRRPDGTPGVLHLGPYAQQASILLPKDGVMIDGGGTLVILPDWLPTVQLTNYAVIAAGDDQPFPTQELDEIRRGYGNCVRNIKIDASTLTTTQIKKFKKSGLSGGVIMAKQSDFAIENVEILNAWGFTGPLTTSIASEHGSVRKNKIRGAWIPGANGSYEPLSSAGIWLDGAHYITCDENDISRVLTAISLATNKDFLRTSVGNVVSHNKGDHFYGYAVAISGTDNLITYNEWESDRGGGAAVFFTAYPGYPVTRNYAAYNKYTFQPPDAAPTQRSGTVIVYRSLGVAGSPEVVEMNVAIGNEGVNFQYLASFDSPLCKSNPLISNNAHGKPINWNGGALEADNLVYGNI